MTPLKPVSLALIEATFNNQKGRVTYVYGAKAPSLDCDSHDIHGIDCSGESRYLIAKGSKGGLIIPDGSQMQLEWAIAHLDRVDYQDVAIYAGKDPTRLFIAFLRVIPGKRNIGHVWLGRSDGKRMMTMESHGGVGVDSRPWNASAIRSCTDCFEILATA